MFWYEWFVIVLGVIVFLGLFAPLVAQTITEYEILSYRIESIEMEIHYGEWNEKKNIMNSINQPAVVTFVKAESYCEKARPGTLLAILVSGILLGIICNAPCLVRVWHAMRRCLAPTSVNNYVKL